MSSESSTGPTRVARSGWLWRQTSVLKRWKRNWFVLELGGRILIYEHENDHNAIDFMNIPVERPVALADDWLTKNVQSLPQGGYREGLFGLKSGEKIWVLCAESSDEKVAWITVIDDLRVNYYRPGPAPMYGSQGGQRPPHATWYPGNDLPSHVRVYQYQTGTPYAYPVAAPQGGYYYPNPPPGTTQVVYIDSRDHYGYGTNAGLALAGGMLLGSMFWSPFWIFPFGWC